MTGTRQISADKEKNQRKPAKSCVIRVPSKINYHAKLERYIELCRKWQSRP